MKFSNLSAVFSVCRRHSALGIEINQIHRISHKQPTTTTTTVKGKEERREEVEGGENLKFRKTKFPDCVAGARICS